MRYRKKPVVIEAFRYGIDPEPDWFKEALRYGNVYYNTWIPEDPIPECYIKTLEGIMTCNAGDYLIRGIIGELYPCKPDIFEATYEAVKE
jgi:hypothetical protein